MSCLSCRHSTGIGNGYIYCKEKGIIMPLYSNCELYADGLVFLRQIKRNQEFLQKLQQRKERVTLK